MSSGVGVLGTKGWTKGVDASQPARQVLCRELARDRQIGLASEEVLIVVNGALFGFGWVI